MRRFRLRHLAALSLGVVMTTGLAGCFSSGGDGSINFGTGLTSDKKDITGQRSTFAAGQTVYYGANMKDTVKENTVVEEDLGPGGKVLYDSRILNGTSDVNVVHGPAGNGTPITASTPLGKYTVKILSGGKVEASGTYTVGSTSSQTSSSQST